MRPYQLRMKRYAQWLFGVASGANLAVAFCALAARPAVEQALELDPFEGTNLWFGAFAVAMIALFGVAYALIARAPERHRTLIALLAAGKALAFASALGLWLTEAIGPRLPLLLAGDGVFALLFLDYLRRSARAP